MVCGLLGVGASGSELECNTKFSSFSYNAVCVCVCAVALETRARLEAAAAAHAAGGSIEQAKEINDLKRQVADLSYRLREEVDAEKKARQVELSGTLCALCASCGELSNGMRSAGCGCEWWPSHAHKKRTMRSCSAFCRLVLGFRFDYCTVVNVTSSPILVLCCDFCAFVRCRAQGDATTRVGGGRRARTRRER